MNTRKTKLELTLIGKESRPKLEPRILLEDLPAPKLRQADSEKSYHVPHRVTDPSAEAQVGHHLFDHQVALEEVR